MDKSEAKKISLNLGGEAFLTQKPKLIEIAWNGINLKSKNFPSSWGGGGFSATRNQSCSKLPEMDKSEVKKIFPYPGGRFSATKTKVAWNFLKWINLKPKNFHSTWGGGGFSATKTKVAWNCLKWINLKSKNFPSSWGEAFLPQKTKVTQNCLKWINLK